MKCQIANTPEEKLLYAIFNEPVECDKPKFLWSSMCFSHWLHDKFHGVICRYCWEERWYDFWHRRHSK